MQHPAGGDVSPLISAAKQRLQVRLGCRTSGRTSVAPNTAFAVHRGGSEGPMTIASSALFEKSASDDNCHSRPRGGRVQGAAGAAAQRGRSEAQPLDAAEHGATMLPRRTLVVFVADPDFDRP